MSQDTADERLKRLRLIARSSVVGVDIKWLLEEYDRLNVVFEEACTEVRLSHGTPCHCKYCNDPELPPHVERAIASEGGQGG